MKFVLNLVSQINDCQLSHLYKHIGSFNFDVEKKQILLQNEKIIFKMHEIFPDSWETALYKTLHHYQLDVEPFPGAIGLLTLVIIFVLTIIFVYCKFGNNVKEKIPNQIRNRIKSAKEFVVPSEGPRFRKRDKIAFLGQKMVKRVKAAGSLIRGGQGRKRKMIAKFAKRLLGQQMSPETLQASKLPLPLEYLEEEVEPGNEILPQQLKYVLQNMRVFGHFEQPIFLEIVKQIEYMSVPANQYLFQVSL